MIFFNRTIRKTNWYKQVAGSVYQAGICKPVFWAGIPLFGHRFSLLIITKEMAAFFYKLFILNKKTKIETLLIQK